MRKKLTLLYFIMIVFVCKAQEFITATDSVRYYFQQQLEAFPQEKIYLQTDKSSYLSGERIWVRAHLVDAHTHKPVYISRYVYIEVINPLNDLVKRVKVRPDSTGAYFGHVDLDDDLAEGAYTLRAYTRYLQNGGQDAFFKKTIHILDPFSLQIEPLVSFNVEKSNVSTSIRFFDRQNNDTILPDVVTCKLAGKATKTLSPRVNNVYQWDFSLSEKDKNRTVLLGLIYKGRKYNRFYSIPFDKTEFNVSFFPEGGYLVPDETCQVAFKSLNADGLGENISGELYDASGKEILSFKSLHLGMGFFNFTPLRGESYYAICRNEHGTAKRFDLPAAESKANIVSARIIGNRMMVVNKRGAEAEKGMFSLLIHHKGQVLYHEVWNPATELYAFSPQEFPEGILGVLLLNERREIVSERLLFNSNRRANAVVESKFEKPSYKRREHISFSLRLFDTDSVPASGNIAVSVTDMEAVVQDTTINIMSTLLLSSELNGYIESPASYFKNGKTDRFALDALMLTQGWKRYNIPDILHGKIQTPDAFEPELAHKITGKADGLFGSLKEGQISLLATLDSLHSTEITQADEKGQFLFNVEFPEGTTIHIQSRSKKGGKLNVININKEVFPDLLGAKIPVRSEVVNIFSPTQDTYLEKADQDYSLKFGLRTIMLEEITVTAQNRQKYKESSFYSPIHTTSVFTAEEIEESGATSLRSLLYRMSGIVVRSNKVTTTRSEMPVMFVIDNMNFEDFSDRLDDIDISSIESIFVVRDNLSMPGYYPNTNGAVVITTKIGGYKGKPRRPPSIDTIVPLGYQQPEEFYSPTYETQEQKESYNPDLRTTIFWKPNVLFSEQGEAIIDFYSADIPTTYQVIGEGVSNDGKMIRFEREITVESSSDR